MTPSAASVTPRAVATILRAFMGRASFAGTRVALGPACLGSLADHRLDVVLGELRERVFAAGGADPVESDDERAALLEEEDVVGLLLVDPAPEDPERLLIVARVAPVGRGGPRVAARQRFLHEAGDVVVEERERLL